MDIFDACFNSILFGLMKLFITRSYELFNYKINIQHRITFNNYKTNRVLSCSSSIGIK